MEVVQEGIDNLTFVMDFEYYFDLSGDTGYSANNININKTLCSLKFTVFCFNNDETCQYVGVE